MEGTEGTYFARELPKGKKQLCALIPVEASERFKRVSRFLGPTSQLLERFANIDDTMASRLSESERGLYLLGKSSFEAAFGRPSGFKRKPRSARAPRTPVVHF